MAGIAGADGSGIFSVTRQQYEALTRSCDQVLEDSDASLESVAVPGLHVLSEHPFLLRRYQGLFPGGEAMGLRSYHGLRVAASVARALRIDGKAWFGVEPSEPLDPPLRVPSGCRS